MEKEGRKERKGKKKLPTILYERGAWEARILRLSPTHHPTAAA